MDSLQLFSCVLGYLVLSAACTNGAVFRSIGKCPPDILPGDDWYPGECQMCSCDEDGYSCYTCGKYALDFDVTSCYTASKSEERYPNCCKPTIKCRGDEDFDERLIVG